MAAAIAAARRGASVTILERNDRLGKKILSTGNGRCNLGNLQMSPLDYYGGSREFVAGVLERFGTEETVAFFRELGLLVKAKNGYLYPVSEQASSVLDVLRYELKALGVRVVTGCMVIGIQRGEKTGKITVIGREEQGEKTAGCNLEKSYSFDRVILACGGRAAPKTGSDGAGYKLARQLGHTLVPTVPALVQLKCREDYFKAVAGVRTDALVRVYDGRECIASERGEVQLTAEGISGIPVFQLSRQVNYILKIKPQVRTELDLLPDYSAGDFEKLLNARKLLQGERTVEEFFAGMLHKKLMLLFVKLAGLKGNTPVEEADEKCLRQVYELCRSWTVHVTGSNSYDSAQVCAGGVELTELSENFASLKVPGVYLTGELLDVDGRCGGYNLHWAWASGCLAGEAAAK